MKAILKIAIVLAFAFTFTPAYGQDMLKIDYQSIQDDEDLKVIIPILTREINEDLINRDLVDTNFACTVKFYDVVFFAKPRGQDDIMYLENTDSAYLTEQFNGYFNLLSDSSIHWLRYNIMAAEWFRFHSGLWFIHDKEVGISVIKNMTFDWFHFSAFKHGEYMGEMWAKSEFDYTLLNDESFLILDALGLEKFYTIHVYLHEIAHYIEFLEFHKAYPEATNMPSSFGSSERVVDLKSYEMMKRYYPEIEFFINR